MDAEGLREYCLSKKEAEESLPFGPDNLVLKVKGKIFAIVPLEPPFSINLKCDPELAVELREQHDAVQPGYHMNKKHWNTVILDGSLSDKKIREMIDHSYLQVVKSLPKKERELL